MRLFLYAVTEGAGVVLWQQLEAMATKGEDLAASGLTSYMFDVIYVTWFVHVGAALLTTKFWYLYLSIPGYGLYRLAAFAKPYVWPSKDSARAGAGGRVSGRKALPSEPPAGLSKRAEKMKKRSEKGQVRVQQR